MQWGEWLARWNMTSLRMAPRWLDMDWSPTGPDRAAAWELYVELLTRVATQPIADQHGDDRAALDSVYSLFPTTRAIAKRHGRGSVQFATLAIAVLNQSIRPFTAKWHPLSIDPGFDDVNVRRQFRDELRQLQSGLRVYAAMLADMAGVEDLTRLHVSE